MRKVVLDGAKIVTKQDVFDTFREQLSCEDLIGNNLDALHDVLTECPEPVEVELLQEELLQEHLGEYLERLLTMLADVNEEWDMTEL